MTHAKNRALREEMYMANIQKASQGDSDNSPTVERILALRKEKAQLLGFNSHAEVTATASL